MRCWTTPATIAYHCSRRDRLVQRLRSALHSHSKYREPTTHSHVLADCYDESFESVPGAVQEALELAAEVGNSEESQIRLVSRVYYSLHTTEY